MCGIFLFFYSRFLASGRLLLGFCYRTFFCGFPWGLCHARKFFKDITHSYCGYAILVMSLCMCLLAHLYHTPHCSDIAPVYTCARVCLCLCSYLLAPMSPLCFILCCPGIVPTLHLVLCLLVLVVCFSMPWVTLCAVCLFLVFGGCTVWCVVLVVAYFICWFYTFFLMSACSFGRIVIADDYPPC